MKQLLQDLLTEYRVYVLTGIGLPAGMILDTVLRTDVHRSQDVDEPEYAL